MTIEQAKQRLVDVATSQFDYLEGRNNWNKYAEDSRIEKLYGWKPQNQPWCCTYVNWCFLEAFGYDVGSRLTYGGTAACANSAELFRQHGAFVRFPEVGDQAFFYSGGGINHTGIVIAVEGTRFTTMEGNYSDKVSEVQHNVGKKDVAGFGRPNWEIVREIPDGNPDEKPEEKPEEKTIPPLILPDLRNGSTGNAVYILQAALNIRGYNSGKVDGEIGPITTAALNKFKRDVGMPANGIVNRATWGKLLLERK